MNRIQPQLPTGVEPTIFAGSTDDIPAIVLAASGAGSETDLATKLNSVVVPELTAIDGVRNVQVTGARTQQVVITPDPAKLAASGVKLPGIATLLQANARSGLLEHVVYGDHLHRQLVVLDQLLGRHLGLGFALAQQLVAAQVPVVGHADQLGKSVRLLGHPLRRPDALRHLGTVVGRHQHAVADCRCQLDRIHVVEAAVPVEADRAQHAHTHTLRRRSRCRK